MVQPMVYGRLLRVDPIVTIVSALAGAALLGILGALLAIPVAGAVQILLNDWSAHRGANILCDRGRDRFGNAVIWPLAQAVSEPRCAGAMLAIQPVAKGEARVLRRKDRGRHKGSASPRPTDPVTR